MRSSDSPMSTRAARALSGTGQLTPWTNPGSREECGRSCSACGRLVIDILRDPGCPRSLFPSDRLQPYAPFMVPGLTNWFRAVMAVVNREGVGEGEGGEV